jgi:hypothetical protein
MPGRGGEMADTVGLNPAEHKLVEVRPLSAVPPALCTIGGQFECGATGYWEADGMASTTML